MMSRTQCAALVLTYFCVRGGVQVGFFGPCCASWQPLSTGSWAWTRRMATACDQEFEIPVLPRDININWVLPSSGTGWHSHDPHMGLACRTTLSNLTLDPITTRSHHMLHASRTDIPAFPISNAELLICTGDVPDLRHGGTSSWSHTLGIEPK